MRKKIEWHLPQLAPSPWQRACKPDGVFAQGNISLYYISELHTCQHGHDKIVTLLILLLNVE